MLCSESLNRTAKRRKLEPPPPQHGGLLPSFTASLSSSAAKSTRGLLAPLKYRLKNDTTSVGDVAAALEELFKVYDDPCHPDRRQICNAEATIIVVLTMNKWNDSEQVQEYGCALLQGVLLDLGDDVTEGVDRGSIMDAIVRCITKFDDSLHVQQHACVALSNLFSGRDKTLAACAVRFVRSSGGLQSLLKVMQTFQNDFTVQKGALNLLNNLFAYPMVVIPIRVSGAITRVALALDEHRENREIQASGRDAMRRFFP